jgi:hypothetical protein
MTDPKNTKPPAPADPHPSSGHRTPTDIAKDEAGPGGPVVEKANEDVIAAPTKEPTVEQKHIRAAVQRSAQAAEEDAERNSAGRLPPHRSGHPRKP